MEGQEMAKCLIAYFSREGNNYVNGGIVNLPVGNTEVAAKMAERFTGGDLFKIDPVKKYSADYNTCTEEAQKELREDARPELTAYPGSIDLYDTIILGYPIYWGTCPMPVMTFLDKIDFSGKTILPFCTHEGSGMGRSEGDIKRACPGAKVEKGLAIHGASVNGAENEIEHWLKSHGI
jgi:flavodoxin